MKKLTAALLCLSFSLCGCNSAPITELHTFQTVTGDNVIIATPDTSYPGEPVYALATYPVSSSLEDKENRVIFSQSYQKFCFYLDNNHAQKQMEAQLQQRMDQFFADASLIQAQAGQDCFRTEDWVPYYARITHTPTRIDGTIISLYTLHESYSGTAPVQSSGAVNFDAATGMCLKLGDILAPDLPEGQLSSLIVEQLTYTDGLYDGFEDTVTEMLSQDLSEFGNWFLDQEGLCILFSPGEISPVDQQICIPYDMLEGSLKEPFFPMNCLAAGTVGAEIFHEDDSQRFSFLAEVALDPKGRAVAIYPNETVHQLRVEVGTLSEGTSEYNATATVFATDTFYLGNALVVHTPLGEGAPILRVSFFSGGQAMSAYVLYNDSDDSILLAYG